jgi:hypothetical protein
MIRKLLNVIKKNRFQKIKIAMGKMKNDELLKLQLTISKEIRSRVSLF